MQLDRLIELNRNNNILLNQPASESQCDSLELLTDRTLPTDFRSYLLRLNGQEREAIRMFGYYRLMSCDEISKQYNVYLDYEKLGNTPPVRHGVELTDPRVQAGSLWRPGWIFFAAEDTDGNYLAMDLSPTERGVSGQVFLWQYEEPFFPVLATSFSHLVDIVCDQISAGVAKPDYSGRFDVRFQKLEQPKS